MSTDERPEPKAKLIRLITSAAIDGSPKTTAKLGSKEPGSLRRPLVPLDGALSNRARAFDRAPRASGTVRAESNEFARTPSRFFETKSSNSVRATSTSPLLTPRTQLASVFHSSGDRFAIGFVRLPTLLV